MTNAFSPEPLHDDRPVSPEDFEPADPDLEAIVDEDEDEDEDEFEVDGGRLGT